MSIVVTRDLFCDRCPLWFDEPDRDQFASPAAIRRQAARHGWRYEDGRDVCPDHEEGT